MKFWRMTTGAWLATGLIIINFAAVFPRGIQDPDTSNSTNYEYGLNFICLAMTIAFLVSVSNQRVRSWVATICGGVWFGVAIGNYLTFPDKLDRIYLVAFVLFPLGVSFVAFALARIADLEIRAHKVMIES